MQSTNVCLSKLVVMIPHIGPLIYNNNSEENCVVNMTYSNDTQHWCHKYPDGMFSIPRGQPAAV